MIVPDTPYDFYKPDFYTVHESGVWKPWPRECRIHKFLLDDPMHLGASCMLVNCGGPDGSKTIMFHAVCWKDKNSIILGRWDCVNGWTKELKI